MKLIITERQYKLLNEETNGLDDFMNFLIDTHPNVENFKNIVRKFIEDSGCQNIEIKPIVYGVMGLALHDKVVISPKVFNSNLNYTMYVIFHEIAHQYQYKKYGRDKMYSLYVGDLAMSEAIKFLKNTENVADQFAMRKCRQLHKLGLLDRVGLVNVGGYDNMPDNAFEYLIINFRKLMKDKGVESPERVSEIMYNSIVNRNNQPKHISESKQGKVKCSECGWEWDLSDGGKDPYTCHKCGNKKAKLEEEDNDFYKGKPLTSAQVNSIKQINKDAKFITCKNCRSKFTQTTYKKKKSLPICPTCGTHNNEHK